jgi:hypothetical protein
MRRASGVSWVWGIKNQQSSIRRINEVKVVQERGGLPDLPVKFYGFEQ